MSELDRAALAEHASFSAEGLTERAFFMGRGEERCFAILDRPDDVATMATGFVVSHSYADEFVNLRRVERAIARALAALGYPVLSFHRRGYGDSGGTLREAGLAQHLEDTTMAMEHLASETGVGSLGLIGCRLGATFAGLVAAEGGVDRLILMNPVFRPEPYFKSYMKHTLGMRLVGADVAPQRTVEEFLEALGSDGVIDVMGHPLYRRLYEDLAGVDLSADVGAFAGKALVLHASKGSSVPAEISAYAGSIERAGGKCMVELIAEPPGIRFGQKPIGFAGDPDVFVDMQKPLMDAMVDKASRWVRA